ncbi:hypothetical protein [Qaidamihabitans albus]|uniref:hypothetical protein n=1 Tax=Qaidamihabitans albus TaxID=2795733 RepID=UPI001F1A0F37|nr:hypothetical protein [Qaidamihabitans albus]
MTAADALGIGDVELLDYPDGHLDQIPVADLAARVTAASAASPRRIWWRSTRPA